MEDAKSRRLQALSRNGNTRIFDLVRRLNELRPQLKGPVYGPVLQEVRQLFETAPSCVVEQVR